MNHFVRRSGMVLSALCRTVLILTLSSAAWFDLRAERSNPPDEAASIKRSIPDAQALRDAEKLVKMLFAEKYEKTKTQSEKASLARLLLKTGIETTDDPGTEFILLSEAIRLSIEGGKVDTAFQATDELTFRFDVNAPSRKGAILVALSSTDFPISTARDVADRVVSVIESNIHTDNFGLATKCIDAGVVTAKRLKDGKLLRDLEQLRDEAQQLRVQFDEYQSALDVLTTDAKNQDANLVVGKYLGLRRSDWVAAERHVILTRNNELQKLIAGEFGSPETTDERLELADAWWNFGEREKGISKTQVRVIAADWYTRILHDLSGATELRVKQRLASIPQRTGLRVRLPSDPPAPDSTPKTPPKHAITPFDEQHAAVLQKEWAEHLGTEIIFRNSIEMTLVLIPPGEFSMGSPRNEEYTEADESPQHKVRISNAFYLGQTEVTQSQWKTVMGTEPWKKKESVKIGSDYPAVYITWKDAVAFCDKLSKKEQKVYQLPTEAEWEYSCRAGTVTRWSCSNSEKNLGKYAWYKANTTDKGEKYAHLVGQKLSNSFGLFDMHGNPREWCRDFYSGKIYSDRRDITNDPSVTEGSGHVLRGGSWKANHESLRSADRDSAMADDRNAYIGFRVSLIP